MQQYKSNLSPCDYTSMPLRLRSSPSKIHDSINDVVRSVRKVSFSGHSGPPRPMAQVTSPQSMPLTGYRLQRTAYVNRPDVFSPSNESLHLNSGRPRLEISAHSFKPQQSSNPSINLRRDMGGMNCRNSKYRKNSNIPIPTILVTEATNSPPQPLLSQHPARPMPHNSPSNSSKHLLSTNNRSTSKPSPSGTLSLLPARSRRSKSSGPGVSQSNVTLRHKRRKYSYDDDPSKLAMKMSLPCSSGCCYCVYAALLGPVKVFITRADRPKKEPFLCGIKDGNGRAAIPVSRKSDVRGLVYDPKSHSLHPPAHGQRPMFQQARQLKKGNSPTRTSSHTKPRTR